LDDERLSTLHARIVDGARIRLRRRLLGKDIGDWAPIEIEVGMALTGPLAANRAIRFV
jgi:hypothetical protein